MSQVGSHGAPPRGVRLPIGRAATVRAPPDGWSLLRSETTSWPARTPTSPDEENVVYLGALAWKTVVLSGRRNGSAISGRSESVPFIRGTAST